MWQYNYAMSDENSDELYHYGILGMKWEVRRYQNPDGTLTAAGRKRYGDKSPYEVKTIDGDVFRVSRGSKNNYNTKKSKVIKTWGEHLKEKDESNLSKKYKKYIEKAKKQRNKSQNAYYTKAYNKTADDMNNGLIDKFNKQYEKKLIKKYGKTKAENHNYANDENYYSEYNKLFNSILDKHYNDVLYNAMKNNKYYKKAEALVNEYSMEKFDNLVKENRKYMNELKNNGTNKQNN